MKRIALICLAWIAITAVWAQTPTFGYYSLDQVLQSLPAYQQAETQLSQLKKQYADELDMAQQEFSSKYEAFLEGQNTFAPNIRSKRQAELEQLIRQNQTFRDEAVRLLKQAREQAHRPILEKVQTAVNILGSELQLDFIVNTDQQALTYINPEKGKNLTEILILRLK